LKPELKDFPVAPRWPNQNKRVPWTGVSAAGQNKDDEGDNDLGDDEETVKGKKRGRSSGVGNKRQRC